MTGEKDLAHSRTVDALKEFLVVSLNDAIGTAGFRPKGRRDFLDAYAFRTEFHQSREPKDRNEWDCSPLPSNFITADIEISKKSMAFTNLTSILRDLMAPYVNSQTGALRIHVPSVKDVPVLKGGAVTWQFSQRDRALYVVRMDYAGRGNFIATGN